MGVGEGRVSSCTCQSLFVWELEVLGSGPGLAGRFRDQDGLPALHPPFSHREPRGGKVRNTDGECLVREAKNVLPSLCWVTIWVF